MRREPLTRWMLTDDEQGISPETQKQGAADLGYTEQEWREARRDYLASRQPDHEGAGR